MNKLTAIFALFFLGMSLHTNAQHSDDTDNRVFAKFGKGVNFMAKDSSMSLKLGARFQSLFVAEKSLSDGSPVEKELMVRRFRLKMDGFAFSPKLEYKIELALSNRDNAPVIKEGSNAANIVLDAVLKYSVKDNFEIWFGQTKLPGNRERVISSQNLQFVDRSLVNSFYTLDRDMGLQVHHSFHLGKALIRDNYAISLGQGRNFTVSDTAGFSYTGRVEVLPFGEFKHGGDYFDADLERETSPKLSVGAGYSFNDGAVRKGGELGSFLKESRDLRTFFADMMFKYRGWSVSSEYMNKQADHDPVLKDRTAYFQTGSGWNFQTGYLFHNNVELAGRYSTIDPSSSLRYDHYAGKIKEYTIAFSKYFLGHNLKVQTDLSHTKEEFQQDPSLRYRLQVEFAF